MFKNKIDKNSREYLEQKVASSRHSLLLVVIFTVVNLVLLLLDTGRYFLFSASVPYELTFVGAVLNYQETGAIMGLYTYVALVMSAIILGLYLLCWVMAKKRAVWYIVSVVLFALDTVAMIFINMEYLGEYIVDIVFHVYVIYELFQAVTANKKLKNMPMDTDAPIAPQEPWERKDIE